MSRRTRPWSRLLVGGGACQIGWRVFQEFRTADLAGQVVLITGGSRGLVLARQSAKQGCRIAICARGEQELERARNDLGVLGAEVAVRDLADHDRVDAIIERFGQIEHRRQQRRHLPVSSVNAPSNAGCASRPAAARSSAPPMRRPRCGAASTRPRATSTRFPRCQGYDGMSD
jgi:hypothetical protein